MRVSLAMTLAESKMETNTTNFSSEFLPPCAWAKRRFDVELIKLGTKEDHRMLVNLGHAFENNEQGLGGEDNGGIGRKVRM